MGWARRLLAEHRARFNAQLREDRAREQCDHTPSVFYGSLIDGTGVHEGHCECGKYRWIRGKA